MSKATPKKSPAKPNHTLGPIVVIGSMNMDLVCRAPRCPGPGETVLGEGFVTIPGGKGANQAVAAAKLARGGGAPVYMIARVGDDDFGERLTNCLELHKVNVEHVTITEGTPSGVALILVDEKGENSIVVAPGANAKLTPADLDAARELIATASTVVLQLEIPLATVKHAIALCQELGVYTILDPAPAPGKFPRALFGVDCFTPNQTEAEIILEQPRTIHVSKKRISDPKQTATELIAQGARSVILKLGKKGSLYADSAGAMSMSKSYKVTVADTTAAGDAFTGALAVARSEQMNTDDTLRFANAAGALCCNSFGAQPALPGREAVDKLIAAKL